jgi:hypothetical protein
MKRINVLIQYWWQCKLMQPHWKAFGDSINRWVIDT